MSNAILPRYCHQLILFGLAGMLLMACAGERPRPVQNIQSENPTGSRMRGDAVSFGSLPIDRTYEQLTPDERKSVHGWYEDIAPGDEPPFPRAGTKPLIDAVREAQDRMHVMGEMYVVATVEPNGKVSTVKAYKVPSDRMLLAVSKVLLRSEFKPAICSGKACRMNFPLTIEFQRY